MKDVNCRDEMEEICSKEYQHFLEFHNSILSKVQNSMKDSQVNNISFMKQIEQQSYDVFELIRDCQENLLEKASHHGSDDDNLSVNTKAFSSCDVDYNLENMPINRYEVVLTNAPLNTAELYKIRQNGSVLIIGEQSMQVDIWLKSMGIRAKYIPKDTDIEKMSEYFDSSFAGVLAIAGKNWTEDESYRFVKQTFFAAKHTANIWYKERIKPFFTVVTKLGGNFGIDGLERDFVTASLSGLCKSAAKEWANNVSVHYIDVEAGADDKQVIDYISNELRYGDVTEVGYKDKERTIFGLKERYESRIDSNNLPDENDVFLVAGGGEGVTATCIIELAKKFRCKFILFGINKMDDNYAEEYKGMTVEEIRQEIIKEHKENNKKIIPANADKEARRILSQRSLHNTLKELEAIGSQAVYYQCNIMDVAGLNEIIRLGTDKLGKITGIVHGAGIISDSLLNKKKEKVFESVFGVKYYGINNMMDKVDKENLKYLFLFSSVAGFFGNFGQSDYSCGNEYLNHYARYWKKTHPTCKVMSLNWGPWDGGMVDYALRSAMLRRGKILIAPEIGKKYFVDAFIKVWDKSACQLVINDVADLGGDF